MVLLAALLIVGALGYIAVARELPEPGTPPAGRDQTSVIYDRNGDVLAELFAEQNRTDRPIAEIPTALRQGVIATEDKRYYDHQGVDFWGIARALYVDITQGKRHGGSTITQQYVKNAFVTPEFTLKRKVKEALLAYRVEKELSKDEILELYLNTIYFGHGAYGVESASKAYFGKPVTDLTLAESAMIAGVLRSPGTYSPYLDPEAAKARRDTVLDLMVEEGYAAPADAEAAKAEEVVTAGLVDTSAQAPYFVEYIKAQLTEEYGSDQVWRGGISVQTTLDMNMQRAAEAAVQETLDEADDPSAALVAVDPTTGEILAMVGGRDFATQQFNVAAQGQRQPGSSFKPFVFATALEQGIHAEKTYSAGPASLPLPNGQTWKVTGSKSGGSMRLRKAMEKSVNSVWAQLILDIDAAEVVATVERLGMHEGIAAVPAIALGGLEDGVSPLEMASAYGVFANQGTLVEPHGIRNVTDGSGEELFNAAPEATPVMEPAVAWLTTDVLKGVITNGTGKAASIGRPAAGKTGTTQEYRDAWFVGYTPQISAAVWVGYPEEQREMKDVHGRRVTGGSFPAEIWASFMERALEGIAEEDWSKPDGLTTVACCTQTGLRATDYCPETFSATFITGHAPGECATHTTPETIEVPNLVGMTKEKALALLKQLMLLFEVEEREVDGVVAGVVASQSPAPGSEGTTQTVVRIVVSDGGGTDLPPIASFTFGPETPAVGQPVAFDASESADDGDITAYLWEFGDGTQAEGANVSHAYENPGTYEITLWVTDDADQTSSVTRQIEVQ
jgi:penicillin-binding protein 1A